MKDRFNAENPTTGKKSVVYVEKDEVHFPDKTIVKVEEIKDIHKFDDEKYNESKNKSWFKKLFS